MSDKAWSISSLTNFELCPKKYYLVNIQKKFREASSPAMAEGADTHKQIENYIQKKTPFPIGREYLKRLVDKVLTTDDAAEVMVEAQLALNRNLEPVGWFAKDVWVRSIVDYGVIQDDKALIIDWKTGKRKKNDDQLALMSACLMCMRKNLQRVTAAFVWTSSGEIDKAVYERGELLDIWDRFERRVQEFQRAFREEEFPARPNGLCRRHCPVRTCAYHGT